MRRQCELLNLNRSSWYYAATPAQETAENLHLMRLIDRQYLKTPFYGSRRMTAWLATQGHPVNRKRIQRLMRKMAIAGVAPGPKTSRKNTAHRIYPYLLRQLKITRPNQVWSTDITYCPIIPGFMYLVAIIDWYSRYVISWELSNTLDVSFCCQALTRALTSATPDIFNTDQGCQFTSQAFLQPLIDQNIRISMDGKGRALDNIFVERLWRSVKQGMLYLQEFNAVSELYEGLQSYFDFYNNERLHQSLNYATPQAIHFA